MLMCTSCGTPIEESRCKLCRKNIEYYKCNICGNKINNPEYRK